MNCIKHDETMATRSDSQFFVQKVGKKKHVLHFSDGVMEDDDFSCNQFNDENITKDNRGNEIGEFETTWVPWLWHKAIKAGGAILAGCDYVGETIAEFVGITTPKYRNEIEEFIRKEEEIKQFQKFEQLTSWHGTNQNQNQNIITTKKDVAPIEEPNKY